ncbi:hypothetical protein ILUMI_26071 [Ignelater luminosus]|uniref:Uncharacterized protein n=1 Tax=Ignelater luminosus TaxID=2038154 RepID=A0A8K0FW13_IGNLU|nr:hypothetical protein ILUMI_26071 [Ignelater luminosus]
MQIKVSDHNILIQGAQAVKSTMLPIWTLSEKAQESGEGKIDRGKYAIWCASHKKQGYDETAFMIGGKAKNKIIQFEASGSRINIIYSSENQTEKSIDNQRICSNRERERRRETKAEISEDNKKTMGFRNIRSRKKLKVTKGLQDKDESTIDEEWEIIKNKVKKDKNTEEHEREKKRRKERHRCRRTYIGRNSGNNKKIKEQKSCRMYQITAKLIKEGGAELHKKISALVQRIWREEQMPNE